MGIESAVGSKEYLYVQIFTGRHKSRERYVIRWPAGMGEEAVRALQEIEDLNAGEKNILAELIGRRERVYHSMYHG